MLDTLSQRGGPALLRANDSDKVGHATAPSEDRGGVAPYGERDAEGSMGLLSLLYTL